jgi:hypothetical protein
MAQTLAYLGNLESELGYYETAKNFLEQSLLIYEGTCPQIMKALPGR